MKPVTKKSKTKHYKFGILAERIAIILLLLKGYKILKHRYRNFLGEIDIIAEKSKTIIFIEVKARKNFSQIADVLSNNQINRIKNSAQFFINQNQHFQKYNFRYDLIAFNKVYLPKHFKGFFNYD